MKAKKVYEHTDFKRSSSIEGTLDVGKDSFANKERILAELENQGVRLHLSYIDWTEEQIRNSIIEKIHETKAFIDKLVNIGYPINEIKIYGGENYYHHLGIKYWQIYRHSHGIGRALSEEDANHLISSLEKFSLDMDGLRTERNTEDSIYNTKGNNEMLDNLIKNRELYHD